MSTPLSIFSYVRDEASTLAKSLASVRSLADELIVVDTGSTDQTLEIARRYADRVVEWAWRDDFGAAARYAESLCTHRFVCKWDGDWWLEEGLETLRHAKELGFEKEVVYQFRWINEYDPETLIPTVFNTHQFIYDREAYEWVSPIHTRLVPRTLPEVRSVLIEEAIVYHYKDPDRKRYRYDQTGRLIAAHLPRTAGLERVRLLKYGVLNAFFQADYDLAGRYLARLQTEPTSPELRGWLLEQQALYLFSTGRYPELQTLITTASTAHPALDLFAADLEFVQGNRSAAAAKYRAFLRAYPYTGQETNVNFKRYRDHPRHALRLLEPHLNSNNS